MVRPMYTEPGKPVSANISIQQSDVFKIKKLSLFFFIAMKLIIPTKTQNELCPKHYRQTLDETRTVTKKPDITKDKIKSKQFRFGLNGLSFENEI